MGAAKTELIHVTMIFPLGETPFHGDYGVTATVGQARTAAMQHFGAGEDSYYFTHKGERLDDAVTLGSIADHAHGLKFTLVKELIQG